MYRYNVYVSRDRDTSTVMCVYMCVRVYTGFLTEDSYDFANSWAVKGADQFCQRVSNHGLSCNSSKDSSLVSREFTCMHRHTHTSYIIS